MGTDPALQLGAFLLGDHQRRGWSALQRLLVVGDEQPSYANN
jgi:hypothetical protein